MKHRYRNKEYFARDILDVQIYPEWELPRKYKRQRRYKPTSDVQSRLNSKNRDKLAVRTCNLNFSEQDIRLDLTYNDDNLPSSLEESERLVGNFLRALKTYRHSHGLGELKYFWVTHQGSRKGRIHHHLIISGGIPLDILAKKWGKGYTTVKPLQFDDYGIEALVRYMLDGAVTSRKVKYHPSRNLEKPEPKSRANCIGVRAVRDMFTRTDTTALEALYPDYDLIELEPYYNDINGGYYFEAHFRRKKKRNKKPKH